jgi:hypothetical protein
MAVAGALWLGAALDPDSGIERQLSSLVGSGTSATGGSGSFVLCAGASRPNCVIDGDTIRYGGVKIRLADIDAPEVFSPKCASEAARGKRATQRLLELMNAGPFELVSGGRDEDRYGRKLRTSSAPGARSARRWSPRAWRAPGTAPGAAGAADGAGIVRVEPIRQGSSCRPHPGDAEPPREPTGVGFVRTRGGAAQGGPSTASGRVGGSSGSFGRGPGAGALGLRRGRLLGLERLARAGSG